MVFRQSSSLIRFGLISPPHQRCGGDNRAARPQQGDSQEAGESHATQVRWLPLRRDDQDIAELKNLVRSVPENDSV